MVGVYGVGWGFLALCRMLGVCYNVPLQTALRRLQEFLERRFVMHNVGKVYQRALQRIMKNAGCNRKEAQGLYAKWKNEGFPEWWDHPGRGVAAYNHGKTRAELRAEAGLPVEPESRAKPAKRVQLDKDVDEMWTDDLAVIAEERIKMIARKIEEVRYDLNRLVQELRKWQAVGDALTDSYQDEETEGRLDFQVEPTQVR